MKTKTICQLCKTNFIASSSQVKSGFGKFCSRKCYSEYRKLTPYLGQNVCKTCGNKYFTNVSSIENNTSKYCSNTCRYNDLIPIDVRFWQKVEKTEYCWNWIASTNYKGYGIFECEQHAAHRYSYFLHFGKIPNRMLVCHKCDNPKCVNPAHLFLGTNDDNMRDMMNKNRSAKGSENGRSKLTEKDIPKIKELVKIMSHRKIAKIFNVAHSTIGYIVHNKQWRHVV